MEQLEQERAKSKQLSEKKFIGMMNSLTWHIRQNIKYQDSIFECLNSDQEKRLFEGIKDQNKQLRITATVFILYLLNNNQKILNLIMKRDGLEVKNGPTKYIIGGLSQYQLPVKEAIEITQIIDSIEVRQGALCWSISLKNKKVRYLSFEKITQQKISNLLLYDKQIIDPKENIVGVFVNHLDPLTRSKISIKNTMSQTSLKSSGYSDKIRSSRY